MTARRWLVVAVGLLILGVTGRAAGDRPEARSFVAPLRGKEEVPPVKTRARGMAFFQLNGEETELEFRLIVANIRNLIAAHIHLGASGTNGPVVAFLFGPVAPGGGRIQGVIAEGTLVAGDVVGPIAGDFSALIAALRDGTAYVNVHTDDGVAPVNTGPGDFPGGEIRGQVRIAGPP